MMYKISRFAFTLSLFFCFICAFAQPVPMVSYNVEGKPSKSRNVTLERTRAVAWTTDKDEKNLYLNPKGGRWPKLTEKGELFLELVYADCCYGRVKAYVKTKNGYEIKPDKYTQVVMLDTKKWKTAYFRFPELSDYEIDSIVITTDQSWWREDREITKDPFIGVAKATVSATPFKNGYFNYLLEESWRRPYDGPTVKPRDNTTLKGKTMVGYQGWFRTPNDAYDAGWVHWGGIPQGHFSVDMWPYNDDYPQYVLDKAHEVKTLSGKPAYLFSSARPEVVYTHFKWMQEYNIDGAFLQRFIGGRYFKGDEKTPEWVMANVREAANRTGRIWAIEYDVSGCNEKTLFKNIEEDWKWLVDEFGIREDPNYARVDGKPVVFVWGMQLRGLPLEEANKVVNFLKYDKKYGGNYFIGGANGRWKDDPEWVETHFKKHDAILFWMHQSYAQDKENVKSLLGDNVLYLGHIKPGFSWYNLKHYQSAANEAYTPRNHGKDYERQIESAIKAGVESIFIGMYDEYDESTAIIPMSDDPPPTPKRRGVLAAFMKEKNTNGERVPPFRIRKNVELDFSVEHAKNMGTTNYIVYWNGSIEAPKDGTYTFSIDAPEGDAYQLTSSNKRLIDERSHSKEVPPREARVELKKGEMFPFRITYTHREGEGVMRLMWEGPGIERQPVPEEVLWDAWGRFITNEGDSPYLYLELSEKAHDLLNPEAAYKKDRGNTRNRR